jgi:hypothetical protein
MEFTKVVDVTLTSQGFLKNEESGNYENGKYRIEVKEGYEMVIKHNALAKKNEHESIMVWIVVFNGMIRSALALETIIKAVCYERSSIGRI